MIVDDFESAVHTFKNNKGRTVLSLSGIMIGIACVIAVTTLANSLEYDIKSTLNTLNPNLIVGFSNDNTLKINDDYRKKLLSEVPNLKNIYYADIIKTNIVSHNTTLTWREVHSVDYGWMQAEGLQIAYGSGFTTSDYVSGTQKIIIGEQIAAWLFPEGNPVGKKIWLYVIDTTQSAAIPKCFEVCGVLANTEMVFGQPRYYLVIPRMATERAGIPASYTQIDFVSVNQEAARSVEKEITAATDRMVGHPNSLSIFSLDEIIEEWLASLKIVTLIFSIIASLSLLVGGIGIMNIMIVTVTERKQEIGIRKAIGASKKNIITQFLTEATTLTFVGAILGCIFGFALSVVLLHIMNNVGKSSDGGALLLIPDVGGMVIAVLVSIFIGVFFGLYPALQAAKLDPVIALEEE